MSKCCEVSLPWSDKRWMIIKLETKRDYVCSMTYMDSKEYIKHNFNNCDKDTITEDFIKTLGLNFVITKKYDTESVQNNNDIIERIYWEDFVIDNPKSYMLNKIKYGI